MEDSFEDHPENRPRQFDNPNPIHLDEGIAHFDDALKKKLQEKIDGIFLRSVTENTSQKTLYFYAQKLAHGLKRLTKIIHEYNKNIDNSDYTPKQLQELLEHYYVEKRLIYYLRQNIEEMPEEKQNIKYTPEEYLAEFDRMLFIAALAGIPNNEKVQITQRAETKAFSLIQHAKQKLDLQEIINAVKNAQSKIAHSVEDCKTTQFDNVYKKAVITILEEKNFLAEVYKLLKLPIDSKITANNVNLTNSILTVKKVGKETPVNIPQVGAHLNTLGGSGFTPQTSAIPTTQQQAPQTPSIPEDVLPIIATQEIKNAQPDQADITQALQKGTEVANRFINSPEGSDITAIEAKIRETEQNLENVRRLTAEIVAAQPLDTDKYKKRILQGYTGRRLARLLGEHLRRVQNTPPPNNQPTPTQPDDDTADKAPEVFVPPELSSKEIHDIEVRGLEIANIMISEKLFPKPLDIDAFKQLLVEREEKMKESLEGLEKLTQSPKITEVAYLRQLRYARLTEAVYHQLLKKARNWKLPDNITFDTLSDFDKEKLKKRAKTDAEHLKKSNNGDTFLMILNSLKKNYNAEITHKQRPARAVGQFLSTGNNEAKARDILNEYIEHEKVRQKSLVTRTLLHEVLQSIEIVQSPQSQQQLENGLQPFLDTVYKPNEAPPILNLGILKSEIDRRSQPNPPVNALERFNAEFHSRWRNPAWKPDEAFNTAMTENAPYAEYNYLQSRYDEIFNYCKTQLSRKLNRVERDTITTEENAPEKIALYENSVVPREHRIELSKVYNKHCVLTDEEIQLYGSIPQGEPAIEAYLQSLDAANPSAEPMITLYNEAIKLKLQHEIRSRKMQELATEFADNIKLTETDDIEVLKLLTDARSYSYYTDPTTVDTPLRDPTKEREAVQKKLRDSFNIETLQFDDEFLRMMSVSANDSKQQFLETHENLLQQVPDSGALLSSDHDLLASNTLATYAKLCKQYHTQNRYHAGLEAELSNILNATDAERAKIRTKQESALLPKPERTQIESELQTKINTLWNNVWRHYDVQTLHKQHDRTQAEMAQYEAIANNNYQSLIDALQNKNYTDIPSIIEGWKTTYTHHQAEAYILKKLSEYKQSLRYDNDLPRPDGAVYPEEYLETDTVLEADWKKVQKELDEGLEKLKKDPSHNINSLLNKQIGYSSGSHSVNILDNNRINIKRMQDLAIRRRVIDWIDGRRDELTSANPKFADNKDFSRDTLITHYTATFLTQEEAATLVDYHRKWVDPELTQKVLISRDEQQDAKLRDIAQKSRKLVEIYTSAEASIQNLIEAQIKSLQQHHDQLAQLLDNRTNNPKQALGTVQFVSQERNSSYTNVDNTNTFYTSARLGEPTDITEHQLYSEVIPAYEAMVDFLLDYHTKLNTFHEREKLPDDIYRTLQQLPNQLFATVPDGNPRWIKASDLKKLPTTIFQHFQFDADNSGIPDKANFRRNLLRTADDPTYRAKSDYTYKNISTGNALQQHPNDTAHFDAMLRSVIAESANPMRRLPSAKRLAKRFGKVLNSK